MSMLWRNTSALLASRGRNPNFVRCIYKQTPRFLSTNTSLQELLLEEDNGNRNLELPATAPREVLTINKAIWDRDPNSTWTLYRMLEDVNKLNLLSPEDHSFVLGTFKLKKHFTSEYVDQCKERILHVLEKQQQLGHQLDIRDYNTLLQFFGGLGDINTCEKVWRRLKAQKIRPNIYSYNLYLKCQVHARKGARAIRIFEEMCEIGVKPTDFTYACLIELYGRVNEIEGAERIFNAMLASHKEPESLFVPPNLNIYNTMIRAYGRVNRFKDAIKTFQSMSKNGVAPDVNTFNFLLGSSSCDWNYAKSLFHDMQKSPYEITPDSQTFYYLIKSSCMKGYLIEAMELFKLMQDTYQLKPVRRIYRLLIRAHRPKKHAKIREHLEKEYQARSAELSP
ncbi:hypothetical protein K493DRAFT_320624 [Basidiobolus meristosporus CBS 931.73]|uniref:TPR-like protein n=1 Tax=Basidiobolus meristosporus CBS 931.73 TaxID=1314790 RepID=A0A1Y1X776_9FUNG|nr:hypothetical protein K493DRAFT_320624 [Basidiobolus meristosporus CBS 931.73]|eukprot:ORX81572.1 hypothetical protein K493DRAFT_320624 [Basidiobolus meristosporus CBS 931.73]